MMRVNCLTTDELDWELITRNLDPTNRKVDEKRKLLRGQLNLEKRNSTFASSYTRVSLDVVQELSYCQTKLDELKTLVQGFEDKPLSTEFNKLTTKIEHVERRLDYISSSIDDVNKPEWTILKDLCFQLIESLSEVAEGDEIHHNDLLSVIEISEQQGTSALATTLLNANPVPEVISNPTVQPSHSSPHTSSRRVDFDLSDRIEQFSNRLQNLNLSPAKKAIQFFSQQICCFFILMEKPTFEVASNIKEDLVHLKEWISHQPHIIARTDDQWIYIFFRGCKCSLQRTKEKIEKYYTLKTALPEFFGDRDPLLPNIQTILSLGLLIPLPKASNSSARYFFHQCKFADPEKVHFTDVLKVFVMVLDVVFMEDIECSGSELYLLCDLDGFNVHHLAQATPSLCKKGVTFLRDGFPGRPQGFYFLNFPSILDHIFNTVKPLLGKKLSSRIKIYKTNDDQLFNDVPDVVLPKELGGKGKSIEELKIEWKQKIESYRNWFVEDIKYGCDESKRVGSFLTDSDLFGIEGSFKKLTID
ncbi:hypothetical protein RN001_007973 [Aquatica leii]|uniref:CRAL-TRIO domain-containing protein n=1 Tax=Aquatica leii TaxID=1421715 RepID=A0AAN7SG50_9COLE|nr:hypothetical protein RN001_007973 [Aquatica leii]